MNPNAKNLPEFKKLIERYETITIEEIEEAWDDDLEYEDIKEVLTGFGSTASCTLCYATRKPDIAGYARKDCSDCVYGEAYVGLECTKDETYEAIELAYNPKVLLAAYRARAKYMRTLIEK